MSAPILFTWDGDAMAPANHSWARRADKQFVVGQTYQMVEHHDRSMRSHNQYFAAVAEAWKNLPESEADRFPTAEHLRAWALIKAGYRDERSIVCSSKAEAQRVAAFIRPVNDLAVVVVRGNVVIHMEAKSQSFRAMGKAEFQASKDAVLNILDGVVKVEPGALRREAGSAA